MASGPVVAVWGSTEATVGAVLEALMARGPDGRTERTSPPEPVSARGGHTARRARRVGRARPPWPARYEAWRRRWEGAGFRRTRLGGERAILDVGCSEGRLAVQLARETGRPVLGIDTSDLGFARAFEEASRLDVEHLVGCLRHDAHHLSSLGLPRFAAATFTYSLHCMSQPARALAEVAGRLAPGGVLLVVDWVLRPGEGAQGCRRLTAREIEAMMADAGLTVIQGVAREGVGLVAGQRPRTSA